MAGENRAGSSIGIWHTRDEGMGPENGVQRPILSDFRWLELSMVCRVDWDTRWAGTLTAVIGVLLVAGV